MSSLDKARETQLKNIQAKTGRTLSEIQALIAQSGLTKHSEIRQMLMERLGLGYGDANSLVHYVLATDGQSAAEASGQGIEDVLGGIYTGAKAPLRSIHEAVMQAVDSFGPFEVVPKKGYVSLRRKKQFAMLGPASKGRLEVGLNHKGLGASARLEVQPPGGMCQYKVFLTSAAQVDGELIGWIRQAFESAG